LESRTIPRGIPARTHARARASEEIPVKQTMTAMMALVVVAMAGAGCAGKGPKSGATMATNPGVTDVSITPTPLAADPAPQPLAQPVVSDTPTIAPAPAPVAATPAPTRGGSGASGKYTVQKGDTLWKIATTSYGDGKQWQRIASANPGLTPATLKAGQTIMIP
jgi:5'-nucleotidase